MRWYHIRWPLAADQLAALKPALLLRILHSFYRAAKDLPPGYYSYLVKRQLVIFRYTLTILEIARILHERIDPGRYNLNE